MYSDHVVKLCCVSYETSRSNITFHSNSYYIYMHFSLSLLVFICYCHCQHRNILYRVRYSCLEHHHHHHTMHSLGVLMVFMTDRLYCQHLSPLLCLSLVGWLVCCSSVCSSFLSFYLSQARLIITYCSMTVCKFICQL